MRIWTGLCIVLLLLTGGTMALAQNKSLQAAVVKRNITPETPQMLLGYGARQSTGVHDEIFHRIVVLDDGSSRFYLVSSDICLVSPSQYDRVADILLRSEERRVGKEYWSS